MREYVAIEDFPSLPGETWDGKKKRHREAMRGRIGRPYFKRSSRALRGADGQGNDYREDLAAFPGDPDAYVTGPWSLQRLIDKRKAQGWSVGDRSLQDVADAAPGPAPMSSAEIMEKSRASAMKRMAEEDA